ncbi:MAG TPA: ABC transporter ATP-binding protein [Solirubrobacteraceae bacterium]|jgi:branched-chain amino acid transport system ATP-binding protein|nr:ABC transporter ATP-binding protein [Solirubrobacteraceae bacterium]
MSLRVEGLRVRYGGVEAVRELSLSVAPGEIVSLVGPNGAGKSSTLHAIMGLAPASGSVRVGERELIGAQPEDIARAGVALVPESRRIFAELTVEENLRLGLAARRARGGELELLDSIVELFPIVGRFRARHAGALSGGQQQQLAIARALAAEPDVILLDEPSLGLAPLIVDAVFDALAAIRDRGLAVLLVEQRAQRAVAAASRSHVLAGGVVRAQLGPQDAGDLDRLVGSYLS